MKRLLFLAAASAVFFGCKKKCECPPTSCMPVSVHNGLVAYYPFNGNTQDESGYGNHAQNFSATLTADRNNNAGKAYYFDGTSAYMRVANSSSLNPDRITLMAIVKPMGFNYGTCHGNVILNKGSDDLNMQSRYRLRFDDNLYTNGANCSTAIPDTVHQNFYGDFGTNGAFTATYTPYVKKNEWQCVAFTYDGAKAKFYIDGQLVGERNSTVAYVPANVDLFIGALANPQFPYRFKGAIDEIRIYNRAISLDEVKALCSTCNVN